MPQETKQIFHDAPSYAHGAVIADADPEELRRALDAAFDYRGDVTLRLRDGGVVEGYLFDRRSGSTLESSCVRIMPSGAGAASGASRTVAYSEIAELRFSGKDAAAGKTWENWVRRYAEKKLRGEVASIESERLD